jgi:uncharacterized repeat protein (TIGR01451 family)
VEVVLETTWGGTRRPSVFLGAALLALALGVSGAVAKSGPGQTKVDVIFNSFNKACPTGYGATHKKIGTVNATREKGLAVFKGKLHGATPGSYVINLWDGDCHLLFKVGSVGVDGGGDGNFATPGVVVAGQTFFLDFLNESTGMHNSTKSFKLGSGGGTPAPAGADLGLTKTVSDSSPNVGDTITFTVTLTNAGPLKATNVTVGDPLPAGLSFVSATASKGSYNPATGVWTVGDVNTATPQTLAIQALVVSANPPVNTATVTHSDQADPNHANNSASVGVQLSTDLGLSKTVSNSTPNVGDTITFTVTLTDLGPNPATNVVVGDALPAGLAFVSATPSQGTYNPSTAEWTVGTVTTATPQTLAIQATVSSPNPLTNTATIGHADQTDPVPGNNSASVTETPQQADLALAKTAPPFANVGSPVLFTVTVHNSGPDAATDVVVHDAVPTGFSFLTATPSQGVYDSVTGDWTVGTVAASASQQLTLTATLTSSTPSQNTATVSHSDQFDPDTSNNSASAGVQAAADLGLSKSVSNATPNVGDTITFTVTLTNLAASPATNVAVQDALPAGLTFVSATVSQGTYDAGTGAWTVGTVLAPATLSIHARVDSANSLANTATISHLDQFDPNPINDTATATETPQQADLGLAKTVSDSTPNVGDNITFTVTLTDNGPDPATNVSVQDALPAGLSLVSATPSQGSYTSATGVWTVGTVTTVVPQTLTIQATVNSPDPLTNTASISHSDQFDPTLSNNSASATETPQQADLALDKIVNPTSANTGDPVTFTVTLTNSGPDAATNVTVQDLLPAGYSLVTAAPSQGSYVSGTGVWTVGTVASGGSQTLGITATLTTDTPPANQASISHSDQFDPVTSNNAASAGPT